jgi:hypothetical protein
MSGSGRGLRTRKGLSSGPTNVEYDHLQEDEREAEVYRSPVRFNRYSMFKSTLTKLNSSATAII